MASRATPATSPETTPTRLNSLFFRLYYIVSISICFFILLLSELALLRTKAQNILTIAATPIILLSSLAMNHLFPDEPSHLLVHFSLYLGAIWNVFYKFVPFKKWFETNSIIAVTTKVIAWPIGLSMAFIGLDVLFYATFSFHSQGLGWYGSFHDKVSRFTLFSVDLVWDLGQASADVVWDLGRDLLVSIRNHLPEGVRVNSDHTINSGSASNEPLNDEASLPPPYYHDNNTHNGSSYRKIEGI